MRDQILPVHPNGMRFAALDASGAMLAEDEMYSIGGGAVLDHLTSSDFTCCSRMHQSK